MLLNKLLNRLMELDALHLEIYEISGYTVEQLKDMFLAGYTLSLPTPSAAAPKYTEDFEKNNEKA